jgi:hypothetical protein
VIIVLIDFKFSIFIFIGKNENEKNENEKNENEKNVK